MAECVRHHASSLQTLALKIFDIDWRSETATPTTFPQVTQLIVEQHSNS